MKKCPKCGELVGDNVSKCFNCFFDFEKDMEALMQEQRRLQEEQQREQLRILREKQEAILQKNDIYEYDVVAIYDNQSGSVNVSELRNTLKRYADDGWRLVSMVINEVGHNSNSTGFGGVSSGTNATIDQNILVFERCIERRKTRDGQWHES